MAMTESKSSAELLAAMDRYASAVREVKAAQAAHRGALAVASDVRDSQVLPAMVAMRAARDELDAVIDRELGCVRGPVAAVAA